MSKMLTKAGILTFIITSALFCFYKWKSVSNSAETDQIYFSGNMDKVSVSELNDYEMELNGWPELSHHRYLKGVYLNNVGSRAYAFQEIREDPVDTTSNVLYAQTLDDDPKISGTSRAQMSMVFKEGVDLSVYHTSHRMYLSSDLGYLRNYPSAITWFSIFEIWNQRINDWDGDPAGSARWTLSIKKSKGVGKPLYWDMTAEFMQPDSVTFHKIWRYENKEVEIPLGKWITLDVYMKRGEKKDGRILIKITQEDGRTSLLFEILDSTVYPGRPDVQLSAWQPFKLYTSDEILDWMRYNNKSVSAYYNNFTWYKN